MSPSLRVDLEGDGAWPDLGRTPNSVMHLADTQLSLAALAGGMASGRAAVLFRVDLPDGRSVLIQTSLRALHAAVVTIVARHGEGFMRTPEQGINRKLQLALADLTRQLVDAKQRLGEPVEINLETGDAVWDREQKLRAALDRARSWLLASDLPVDEDTLTMIDDALKGE